MNQHSWFNLYLLLGNTFARCTICASDFRIANGGRYDVTKHISGKHHKDMAASASASASVTSFFKPQTAQSVIEAEARWAIFAAKHNLAFSDHATKLFSKMFPDSTIAKFFLWKNQNNCHNKMSFGTSLPRQNHQHG